MNSTAYIIANLVAKELDRTSKILLETSSLQICEKSILGQWSLTDVDK